FDPTWSPSAGGQRQTRQGNMCRLSQPHGQGQGRHGEGGTPVRSTRLTRHRFLQRALAQVDDLRVVSMLEMCVNTRENSLGDFGVHLPNLGQLKLNGSCLGSVRDLGTSLAHLQVLWLARCGLTDLDGIGSFLALKELYVSYNNVSDLSPLCLLEQLEVLDLEGNSVEDLGQVCYLRLCPRLATLTLEGNPVCLRPGPSPSNKVLRGYNYRTEVRKQIPQLQVLDEVPAAHTGRSASWKPGQDWLIVKEAIKEGSVLDGLLPGLDCPHGAPIQRLSSKLSLPETQPWAPRPWPLSLLVSGGPLPESLLPKDPAPEGDTSNLTHGASRVLCGNPTKGLWERRHQCQVGLPSAAGSGLQDISRGRYPNLTVPCPTATAGQRPQLSHSSQKSPSVFRGLPAQPP
uniref:Leucine-rich repeat-containing protein 56 n=1 Tax=Neovison vison TaxID=452646 RepID=A0A8C7AHQ4_NEOVI